MSKRRARNTGSISARPRKDGRWEARLPLPDGRRRSFYGATRAEAEDKMFRAKIQLEQGTFANPGKAKVEHLWHDYKEFNPDSLRRSTLNVRTSTFKNWIIPVIGHVRLSALSPTHVHAVLAAARKADLSDGSIANIYAAMRSVFRYAVNVSLLGINPADRVPTPPSGEYRELPLTTPDQIDALMTAFEKSKYRAILMIGIGLGLRIGEAQGLRWRDVDLDNGMVRVRNQVDIIDGEVVFVELKTRKSRRDLPLPTFVADALKRERREQNKRRLRLGSEWEHHDLVFTVKGRPLSRQTVANHMQRACESAGVPQLTFHHLRHLCASLLMARNVQPRIVQEILGHSTSAPTMRYQHLMDDDLKSALGLLDSLIAPANSDVNEGAS